ncbi:hypothetical protein JCM11641_002446 [Rhodosporidiobolus odoratus]
MATQADSTLPDKQSDSAAAPADSTVEAGDAIEAGEANMNDDQEQDDELQGQDGEEEIYESSSSPSTETDTLTWINWFCSLPGHEYFCEVAEDFIEDDFNLTGLAGVVPFYKEAMEMILDVEPEEDDESHRVPDVSIVESSAELLYGLIHQRFVATRGGLQLMYAKYDATHFGTCPRVYCTGTKLAPCGRSDLPGVDTVKLFCPCCLDMYVPPSSRFQGVDGAFFGTTFPHLLFQTYPPALPLPSPNPASTSENPSDREPTTIQTSLSKVYVPKIYGFKVSERARSGPRMGWMRMRPRTEGELDWTPLDPSLSSSSGGPAGGTGSGGEKGELFDDDRLEDQEEDDAEEEEEEEAAGGVAAGGTAGGAVGEVVEGLEGATLASPTTPARLPPAKDGRAIKGLPSPRSSGAGAGAAVAEGASQALKASIERHLKEAGEVVGPAVEMPKMPARAVVLGGIKERERGRMARVA